MGGPPDFRFVAAVGLPMPKALEGKYRNEELNRLLQELAWEAVTQEPLTGVKG